MLPAFFAVAIIIIAIIIWGASVRKQLCSFNENVNNAISQIGAQMNGKFEALLDLINVVKNYDNCEHKYLIEAVNLKHITITSNSSVNDIKSQELLTFSLLNRINTISDKSPQLKTNQNYINAFKAVDTFENMISTSFLIYNSSVEILNSKIDTFPTFLISRILGFNKRSLLEY